MKLFKKPSISLLLRHNDKEIASQDLHVLKLVYHDTIFELSPIFLCSGDTLSINYDLNITGYTNGRKTSEMPERYCFLRTIEDRITVRYVRFTKLGEQAAITWHDEFPTDLHLPISWNAERTS